MSSNNTPSRSSPNFQPPDPNNPYCVIERNEDGTPVWGDELLYKLTPASEELRMKAHAKFWESYPPMAALPAQLPPKLRIDQYGLGRNSKDGYLLHYGFLLTTEGLAACAEKHKLGCEDPDAVPLAIFHEVTKRTQGSFEGRILSKESPVQIGPEDVWVITLYSIGRIGIGQGNHRYTEDEERTVINILIELLAEHSHFKQKAPMWFWSHAHGPNFETLQNYENWDVVGLEFEEEVSHECT